MLAADIANNINVLITLAVVDVACEAAVVAGVVWGVVDAGADVLAHARDFDFLAAHGALDGGQEACRPIDEGHFV